eukprot:CAMPEP_0204881674 /NCGR_PEP_ID=MMETSP1349-20130617/2884_1 /ASSEMBLY_ACC=CAM_ASM_000710 /TAXON_ID=215587 /ORGANISM="Aplanochytrium stocchinoi, Strain GSBS06" /LENGTH=218 /DNA_ID=CAMNT_0052040737 /DNA_START=455 /DNA_END=1111 /DNA_ORIENTATION=-
MASRMYTNLSNDHSNKETFHLHAGCVSVLDILEAVGDDDFARTWHERQRQQKLENQQEQPTTQIKNDEGRASETEDMGLRKSSVSSMSTSELSDLESDEERLCECTDEDDEETYHNRQVDGVAACEKVAHQEYSADEIVRGIEKEYHSINSKQSCLKHGANDNKPKVVKLNKKHEDWLEQFCSAYPHLQFNLGDLRQRFQGKEELLGHYLYSRVKDRN